LVATWQLPGGEAWCGEAEPMSLPAGQSLCKYFSTSDVNFFDIPPDQRLHIASSNMAAGDLIF